jgi:hypothetical protein
MTEYRTYFKISLYPKGINGCNMDKDGEFIIDYDVQRQYLCNNEQSKYILNYLTRTYKANVYDKYCISDLQYLGKGDFSCLIKFNFKDSMGHDELEELITSLIWPGGYIEIKSNNILFKTINKRIFITINKAKLEIDFELETFIEETEIDEEEDISEYFPNDSSSELDDEETELGDEETELGDEETELDDEETELYDEETELDDEEIEIDDDNDSEYFPNDSSSDEEDLDDDFYEETELDDDDFVKEDDDSEYFPDDSSSESDNEDEDEDDEEDEESDDEEEEDEEDEEEDEEDEELNKNITNYSSNLYAAIVIYVYLYVLFVYYINNL